MMRKTISTTMLKSRVMKIVLNFLNNELLSVLCIYTFFILYIYISMCVLNTYIDLYTYYIDHLRQDKDFVPNEVGVDEEAWSTLS